jgi:SpoVK/Ycf46/Vps4 family AAA+-type ATPase
MAIINQKDTMKTDKQQLDSQELVQLARLAVTGKRPDLILYIRRLAKRYRLSFPELAEELTSLVREVPNSSSVLRGAIVDSIPVDQDSRLQLARPEYPVELDIEPIWEEQVRANLEQIVVEREMEMKLAKADLHPTKSALFVGPPGVGKTLAARWIARRLERPLIVLDLSAVMSSFLGRTGNNIRNVLDYAKGVNCVLLLDEFDAIAKRRDDAVEIGELKRLVTVLLQEIDEWPPSGLLLAATNHQGLLDPAVWRRFEMIVEFPMPSEPEIRQAIELFLGEDAEEKTWSGVLAHAFSDASYAEIRRDLLRAKRNAVVHDQSSLVPLQGIVRQRVRGLGRDDRMEIALGLLNQGLSQREAHDWTGVSRDTIRKAVHQ